MENRRLAAFGGIVGATSLSSAAAQEDEAEVSINATESDDDAAGDDEGIESSGVDLSGLGDSIAATVTSAAGADDDGEEVAEEETEGVSADTTLTLDNTPGTSIADASGGDDNFAFVS